MMKRIKIDNKIYNVINSYDLQNINQLPSNTAILSEDGNVYPIRSSIDIDTGLYKKNNLILEKKINESEDLEKYSNKNIIDFDSAQNIHDIIEKSNNLRDLEKEILTSPDNIFTPSIGPNDTAEMKALKQAIINKHIDLDKYEDRFGASYSNDKRRFKKDEITMKMLKRICNNLDIKASIILEDTSSTVPNPMGSIIKVELTSGGDNYDEK